MKKSVLGLSLTIALIGCKSIPKKPVHQEPELQEIHSNIDWNELVKNQKDAERKKLFKNLATSGYQISSESRSMSNPKMLEMGTAYLYNLHKSIPFEKVVHYRDGLLARTKDKSFFFITPNPEADQGYKLDQTMVQMMSEHLYCFVRGKVESENLVAYRCKDGRVIKFLIKRDNVFTKVSAKAYENVKLEWLALESSFSGTMR